MGYANDEGRGSGPGLGMHVAVGSDATIGWASEVDSKARLNYPVSRIEGGEWACVEREYAVWNKLKPHANRSMACAMQDGERMAVTNGNIVVWEL